MYDCRRYLKHSALEAAGIPAWLDLTGPQIAKVAARWYQDFALRGAYFRPSAPTDLQLSYIPQHIRDPTTPCPFM